MDPLQKALISELIGMIYNQELLYVEAKINYLNFYYIEMILSHFTVYTFIYFFLLMMVFNF